MMRVIVESPYAASTPELVAENVEYAREAVRDCLGRGEAPYASHLFFTQPGLLDDTIPEQRTLGIEAGLAWGEAAQKTVVYDDLGVTPGMQLGINRARAAGRVVEYRRIRE